MIKIMKRILPVIMFLLVTTSVLANGIEGTWKAKMTDGDMELTFVFKMVDGTLTGVVRSPNGDMNITNTKVNGNQFSFDVLLNDMTIKHDCVLQDDGTISMKASGTPMGDMEMELKRQD
jgi:hypothetical protein